MAKKKTTEDDAGPKTLKSIRRMPPNELYNPVWYMPFDEKKKYYKPPTDENENGSCKRKSQHQRQDNAG